MTDKKHFYLLVEEGFRELTSRLLIACEILSPHHDVWIGQQWWFAENFGRLPPGVVLFKGSNSIQLSNMRRAKQVGHLVASIEEEAFGLAVFDGEKIFDPDVGRTCDLFCVQGDGLAEFLCRRGIASGQSISVTGNPRADLLRAPHDNELRNAAVSIRCGRGAFVLVNTNYASINPYDIDVYNYFRRCIDAGVYDPDDTEDLAKFDHLIDWEHRNLRLMIRFIRCWPEFNSAPLVIRPHPSENGEIWHRTVGRLNHVDVIDDTDHLSWIAASTATIHTSSTTGLEAHLLGVPSVNLVPEEDAFSNHFMANLVNRSFSDARQAARFLCSIVDVGSDCSTSPDGPAHHDALAPHLRVDVEETAARRVARALIALSAEIDPRLQEAHHDPFIAISNTLRQSTKAGLNRNDIVSRLAVIRDAMGAIECPRIEEMAAMVFRFWLPEN